MIEIYINWFMCYYLTINAFIISHNHLSIICAKLYHIIISYAYTVPYMCRYTIYKIWKSTKGTMVQHVGFWETCCKDLQGLWLVYTIVCVLSMIRLDFDRFWLFTNTRYSHGLPTHVKDIYYGVLWISLVWFKLGCPKHAVMYHPIPQLTECLLKLHPLVSDIASSGLLWFANVFVVMSPTKGCHVGSFRCFCFSSILHFWTPNLVQSWRRCYITGQKDRGHRPFHTEQPNKSSRK